MPLRLLTLTLAAAAAIAAWDASGLDLVVSTWFGDRSGFAWRDHWLTRELLHDGGRSLAWALFALLDFLARKLAGQPVQPVQVPGTPGRKSI